MDPKILSLVLAVQGNEITEYIIYLRLAEKTPNRHNRRVLEQIAEDELKHYQIWKSITKQEIRPKRFRVFWYVFISRLLGLSFGLKLMERSEELAQDVYSTLKKRFSEIGSIIDDEQRHEADILDMLEEERLEYASSIVLGLNDALVELTGALAGLTLALQNTRIIAVIGLITGIAASLSMAASGYLSSREEKEKDEKKSPLKSALYTGVTYLITVSLLILPYLLIEDIINALASMLLAAICIIAGYTFYITTAKGLKFWGRFAEMAIISLAVAAISFAFGWVVRDYLGIEL